jgi:hypothetical protein
MQEPSHPKSSRVVRVYGGASTVEGGACGRFLSGGGGSVAGLQGRVDGGTWREVGAGGETFLFQFDLFTTLFEESSYRQNSGLVCIEGVGDIA